MLGSQHVAPYNKWCVWRFYLLIFKHVLCSLKYSFSEVAHTHTPHTHTHTHSHTHTHHTHTHTHTLTHTHTHTPHTHTHTHSHTHTTHTYTHTHTHTLTHTHTHTLTHTPHTHTHIYIYMYIYRCSVHFVVIQLAHQLMHIRNIFFTLKHLKSLQHVSMLGSSSGSYTVPC